MSKMDEINAKDRQAFNKFIERKKRVSLYFNDILKTKEIIPIYNNLFEIKRELNYFFKKNLSDVCKTCRGQCCKRYVLDLVNNEDLLMWSFFNFELPTPNWEYLAWKEARNGFKSCIFLEKNGCLLGEHRPFYCYTYVEPTDCDPGMKILEGRDFSVTEKLIEKYRKHSFK